jgi:hypothetical protein
VGLARRARLALLGALVTLLLTAASASAAPGWIDGNAKYVYAPNCASIIFGNPYIEAEAATYASFYADPNNLPDAGEVFYIRMVAAGIGFPCGGAYANFELALHPEVRLAISPDFPVYCYAYRSSTGKWQRETTSCPQGPTGQGRFGQSFNPVNSKEPAWPLPQGVFWQIQVPVYSKKRLVGAAGSAMSCGDCFIAPTQIIDGNGSPYTNPHQFLNVDRAEPGGGFPNPFHSFPANNKVRTTAYEFNYFEPGTVFSVLTEDVNGNGVPENGEPLGIGQAPATTNDYAVEMSHEWSNLKGNKGYIYELGVQLNRDGLFYASEPRQINTPNWPAPPGAIGSPSGGGQGVGTVPPKSKTSLPPAQPDAPEDPFSALDANALKRQAQGQRVLVRIAASVKKIKRGRLLKKKSVVVPFNCADACSIKSSLKLGKKTIAKGKGSLKKAGKGRMKLKLTKSGRKTLKRKKKGKLALVSETRLKGFPLFKSNQKLKLSK